MIPWWQNIPLVSYFFLRARCSNCRSRIHYQYPIIEALVGFAWLIVSFLIPPFSDGNLLSHVLFFIFIWILIVTTVTDFQWKLIPDQASYLLITIGVCSAYWNPFLNIGGGFSAFQNSFLGIVGGALPLWLIGIGGKKIIGKEAMGGGDIKLLAGMGSFMGWESALLILMVGSLLGCFVALLGLLTRILRRGQYIPFGPFLNAGALLVFIFRCNQSMFDNAVCSFFHFR
jgi:leader peptidase (prepilin peptidase)/N-methyltransferase